jgi:choline dehydrogenase-like flavoprotein
VPVVDPILEGIKSGWKAHDAGKLDADQTLEADIAIVGSGAGGGVAAEVLSGAGLKLVLLEEGPLKTSSDFTLRERDAFAELYREGFATFTKDRAIAVLQGRCVGGSTTINWTSSFPTPAQTLKHWNEAHGISELTSERLAPWFAHVKERLNWTEWTQPNANNDVLRRGCTKLGIPWAFIPRNVKDCWNLGYCGMGCPTNAKQSMLVTTIPQALKRGSELYYNAHVERLELDGHRVVSLNCKSPSGKKLQVRARHVILSAGAIATPALLLRSRAPDPRQLVGKRTFLHPTTFSMAVMPSPVIAYSEAPQSVYTDHFNWLNGPTGPVGYKIEVPPLHPMLTSGLIGAHGAKHLALMREYPRLHCAIALLRDGFHAESPGGSVSLRPDGSPVLTYDVSSYLLDGARRAFLSMAEIQFAAGAEKVIPNHLESESYSSWAEARAAIAALPMRPHSARLGSAHVMGGSAMGPDPESSVTSPDGKFHRLDNLSIFDGSLFPTSIGTNPTMSICALTYLLAEKLSKTLVRA